MLPLLSGTFAEGFFPGFAEGGYQHGAHRQHSQGKQRRSDGTLDENPRIAPRDQHRPA